MVGRAAPHRLSQPYRSQNVATQLSLRKYQLGNALPPDSLPSFSEPENQPQAITDLLHGIGVELTHSFGQKALVDGDHLRDIYRRFTAQALCPLPQEDIARSACNSRAFA